MSQEEFMSILNMLEAAAGKMAAIESFPDFGAGMLWVLTSFLQALEMQIDPAEFEILLVDLRAAIEERIGDGGW